MATIRAWLLFVGDDGGWTPVADAQLMPNDLTQGDIGRYSSAVTR